MLGSAADAEDFVQEAYVRWHRTHRSGITSPSAWLTKVTTNLCLNDLTSARARRTSYVGPWLPEPALSRTLGPLDTAEQRDSVSLAVLVMERLTALERAAFVLREAFGYGHREIAGILTGDRHRRRAAWERVRPPGSAPTKDGRSNPWRNE